MNRAELEALGREALIALAESKGVKQVRVLTRPEIVDELLLVSEADSATKQKSRGLFGRARDLLARVVEKGLHLHDAAERIRSLGAVPDRAPAPAALPTVTLAEIYAAQGHRARAIEILDDVLSREPDHAAARALAAQLRDEGYAVEPPRLPPEKEEGPAADAETSAAPEFDGPVTAVEGAVAAAPPLEGAGAVTSAGEGSAVPARSGPVEPTHMLDDAPLPPRYDVDECVAISVDPTTLYVYWEVRTLTLDYVRATRPGGDVALRVVVIVPTWDGPRSNTRDHDVHQMLGDFFVRDLPAGCVVRAAIGYRVGEVFVPIAHSAALETPPGSPSLLVAESLVRWTPDGAHAIARDERNERNERNEYNVPAIERAVGRVRSEAALAERQRAFDQPALGSSERWAVAPWA
ncbi:MAG TPA: DUF4912 domain-containing protein [Polyangiaceae bacterium]|jgi:hypothetical protein|nr:DUF4912 domain-containing protein [Polyangiaceae bacterium]